MLSECCFALTMIVLLLPPRAACNSFVRAESLYGTITFFFPVDISANELNKSNTDYKIKAKDHFFFKNTDEKHLWMNDA